MESYKKSFKLGDKEITLESGKVARQATGAVIATCEDTQVLATVVVGKAPGEHQDFFPLTVNYQEKTYATGKIPGGFFKREGRPTEKETLTSRLIDRPLRPLFNDDFLYEVQVICTVISSDKNVDPDKFILYCFEDLLDHRIPIYDSIAKNWGITINADDITKVKNEKDFINLVSNYLNIL